MARQLSDKLPAISLGDELAVIAQRAQTFTGAFSAAIALRTGGNQFRTVARSGSNAPDLDTPVRLEGSFAGQAIRSAKELRCDDAETDSRIDTSIARAMGIRSMVAVPIRDQGRIIGVLSVFAAVTKAFTIT